MAFYTTTPVAGFDPSTTFSSLTDSTVAGKVSSLGTQVTAQDADGNTAVFRFVEAGGTITQYDWLGIDEDNVATALTKAAADDGHSIGLAQVGVTSGYYFWAAMQGSGGINGRVAASCAADVALYTTSNAGILDDEPSSQTQIAGVVAVAANSLTSSSNVQVIATYPRSATF